MSVILLRLEAPLQAWGIGSRFTERHTEAEPTKSGIIGLLASALGRSRQGNIDDLTSLEMAVRVDREGTIFYDYHTTLGVLRASAMTSTKVGTVVSRRFYISDACFLVGLSGKNEKFMQELLNALKNPKWPLHLGRKSCLPSTPILLSSTLVQGSLENVMKHFPWQGRNQDVRPSNLRLVFECDPKEGERKIDVPISFKPRKFINRFVKTEFIPLQSLLEAA